MIHVPFHYTYKNELLCAVLGTCAQLLPPGTRLAETGQEPGAGAGWGGRGLFGFSPEVDQMYSFRSSVLNILPCFKKKKNAWTAIFCLYGLSQESSFYFKSKTPAQRVRKLAILLRLAVQKSLY
jgi:hypothetical protein